jgi:cytochrome c oxidase subunit 2
LILQQYTSIKFIVHTVDVTHASGINEFGIKLDTIPNKINSTIIFNILFNGEYQGFCYELCGKGHSIMLFIVDIIIFI